MKKDRELDRNTDIFYNGSLITVLIKDNSKDDIRFGKSRILIKYQIEGGDAGDSYVNLFPTQNLDKKNEEIFVPTPIYTRSNTVC